MKGQKVIWLLIMVWLVTSGFSAAPTKYDEILENYRMLLDSRFQQSLSVTDEEAAYLDELRKTGLKVPSQLSYMGGFYEFSDKEKEYGINRLVYSGLEKGLGVKLSYVEVGSSEEEVLQQLANGSLDVTPILRKPSAQYPDFLLSSPISIQTHDLFYTNEKRVTYDSLAGKRIGILGQFNENSRPLDQISGITFLEYKSIPEAYAALKTNRIDFIYANADAYKRLIDLGLFAQPVSDSTIKETYHLLVGKSNPLLLSILNKISSTIGQVATEYEKEVRKVYLNDHFLMTEKEKEFIRSLGKVRVMVDDNFAPLSFYEKETGTYSGASVELFTGIADMIGLDYEFIHDGNLSWSDQVNKIKNKEIDILFPISMTPARQAYGHFSEPYYSTYYSVIAKAENTKKIQAAQDLLHQKVGIVTGTSIADFIERILPQEQITYFASDQKMYNGLKKGEIDYLIQNENVFLEDYYEKELFNLTPVYRIAESPKAYCYFFQQTPEMEALSSMMNRAMNYFDVNELVATYKVGEIELRNRYIEQKRTRDLIVFVLFIVVVGLLLLAIGFMRTKRFSKKLEKEVAINEMAYLQSQIKPHFLYNALSAITAFCYTDSEKAGDLLISLSKYLRIVFNTDKRGELVTLQREMDLVQAYVDIEQARYGERLRTVFEVEESCLSYTIMPLMIQPLVENAIRHGVMKKAQGGTVRLSIRSSEEMIQIRVADDGAGMSEQQIKEVLSRKETVYGVGLANINQRLGHFADRKLTIESVEGQGTTVTISVPILRTPTARKTGGSAHVARDNDR